MYTVNHSEFSFESFVVSLLVICTSLLNSKTDFYESPVVPFLISNF